MKDFLSITMKSIHPLDVFFDRDRPVSIQARNLRILATKISKDSKGIARSVFAYILISMSSESFSPHY